MAQRTKTIEYAFDLSTASVASATARDFTQHPAIAIPESSSRTFRSVTLEVSAVDNGTVAASNTAVLIGIALGAVARSDVTTTVTLVNSGENQSWIWTRDVTSYFVTNYTGTTMTADCRLTQTGNITSNCTAKLIITYEFDDSSATTRIRTVKIPMDGNTGDLTTSFTNMGGVASQIPNLDSFLPEASKVYRDIFFQIEYNTGTTAVVSSELTMRYDGATSVTELAHARTLNSGVSCRRIDNLRTTLTTNATHSVEALTTSTTGNPCPCLSGALVVTYEYDHANSTTIMNSAQFSGYNERGWNAGTATGDKARYSPIFSVQEPATITLVQSGIMVSFVGGGTTTHDLRVGGQSSRTFVHTAAAYCKDLIFMRRFDSGAVGGSGHTIARGFNTMTIDVFTTSATDGNRGSCPSAIVYLNYTSGKDADGDGVHLHTTHWITRAYLSTGQLAARNQVTTSVQPIIPETDYWISSVTHQTQISISGSGATDLAINMHCEVQSSEAEAAGWRNVFSFIFESDNEVGYFWSWADEGIFKQWPNDPRPRALDIETNRDYRFDTNIVSTAFWQVATLLTYHAITYAIAGDITGSSGGTVTIKAHLAAAAGLIPKGTEIANTSRSGNGAYSMTWFDNTVNCFAEGRESSTLLGRSDDSVAV
jgi:hypothetical protein